MIPENVPTTRDLPKKMTRTPARLHLVRHLVASVSLLAGWLSAEFAPAAESSAAGPLPCPTFHYSPRDGVLGDVIPYFHNGVYHLFYLKGAQWGHLRSRNLVCWEELPDALDKGQGDTAPDGENCWTGSIVADKGTFHLFYTGKNSRDPKGDQKVMHATSPDLLTWTKHSEDTFYADGTIYWSKPINGAIDEKQIYHHQAFRDPEVVWDGTAKAWSLLLHAMLADGSSPAFARYTSTDLKTWRPAPPLLVFSKTSSGDCPNLVSITDRWYLLSAEHHYTSAPRLQGSYTPEIVPFEAGELFVPKSVYDGQRHVLLGWVGSREGRRDSGKGAWGGVLSLPRELYADAQGRLRERPIREVVDAFRVEVAGVAAAPANGANLPTPPDFLLHCAVTGATDTARAVIALRQPATEPNAGYRLTLDFKTGQATLSDPYRSYTQPCALAPRVPVDVRVFALGDVIECFLDDSYAFTMRMYDHPTGATVLSYTEAAVSNLSIKTVASDLSAAANAK